MEIKMENVRETIRDGRAVLGIEFGSTRIKAVLVDESHTPIASGVHNWENQLADGIWTYSTKAVWSGLADCYGRLAAEVLENYGVRIKTLRAIGFSGMMHGYMAFDGDGRLLVPFRTWRNTNTAEAAAALSEAFRFNIPQRWSIAHLYQAVLNGEEHTEHIRYLTTLAGYVHWTLTGEKVTGIGEASGMFPIDAATKNYDQNMLGKFRELIAEKNYPWKPEEILPGVRIAGEPSGVLTPGGAKLLDVSGNLAPGIPLCPPEGDAGTGMVATNSVAPGTGNVSAGTSVFAMVVLKQALKEVHEEIDVVTTPCGHNVAMVHCNNCTSDLNAWTGLFSEFAELLGVPVEKEELYAMLYNRALEGEKDCGGLLSYNYISGEPVMGIQEGRPLFVRRPGARLTLASFMRTHLYSSLAALKSGLDILLKEEGVEASRIYGHGGLFKTKGVAQGILAAAVNTPVAVMETAGEGGPWGMALLASYMAAKEVGETLEHYLCEKVFQGERGTVMQPDPEDAAGFDRYLADYKKALAAERIAAETIPL